VPPDEVAASVIARSLADAAPRPYWLEQASRPEVLPGFSGTRSVDLLIIGGGYTGLWAAWLAASAAPGRSVALVEAGTCGWAASGRNGGFCAASLTHGVGNGLSRFPNEAAELDRLGRENLAAIEKTAASFEIGCDFERTGALDVATAPYQVDTLRAGLIELRAAGYDAEFLDRAAVRAEVDSPTYLAGVWNRDGMAMVDPAKMAWGLRALCLAAGVTIYEQTRVAGLSRAASAVVATTLSGRPDASAEAMGTIRADRVVLATNAFPPLLRRLRQYVVPVYDYALMSAPLSAEQLASIGWANRQGLGDTTNQFHYYRLTADNRILFGGYDAIYHFGGRMHPALEQRPATFAKLARHFYQTFPTLIDVPFTHKWAGVIDTCTRFCAFWGQALGGRLAYVAGYTGLGVGASRFGAKVCLDLVDGVDSRERSLEMVRTKPIPFPPEPMRSLGVNLTRWSLAAADRHEGRRNLWLRTMDALGLGFDS
jgi:glycine/D-amino acid oxidase-like deaminating enzyme